MNKINCIITDDEPIARQGLRSYVQKIDYLTLVGECEDAMQLSVMLMEKPVDLLFLDVEMPYVSGIELLSTLKNPPHVIITSAHAQYALQSYEYEVTDYLLKPISFERFLKAVNRAAALISPQLSSVPTEYIFVRSDYHRLHKIIFSEILYVESQENYIYIYTQGGRVMVRSTLSGFSGQLPNDQFVQIHKSYIINMSHISCIDGNMVEIDGKELAISRTFRDEFFKRLQ
ncbi:MAG: response regulator transcription factor [Bacteroidaceae bacterium]|jgi:DNA-binding LytR/AlgR family response regulator|nr:response regulator transcription factor [Bacteroidaceae bacterium]